MWHLTRQERNLLLILAIILAVGTGLVILKRSFAWEIFSSQEGKEYRVLNESPRDLMVFVKGFVAEPGIYRLPIGSRIIQAVQKAKPNQEADIMSMPLADFVVDGQTILVPKTEVYQEIKNDEGLLTKESSSRMVNINQADAVQLDSLPGIGPELALRIVTYREQHPFTSKEDLLKVTGIGRKKYEEIKERITIE